MRDEDADVSGPGSGDALTLTATARAQPAALWRSLTERREQWWPGMRFDAEPGAALREEWTEDGQVRIATGVVLESSPGVRLAFAWQQPEWEAPLRVVFSLAPAPDGTVVRLHETGFAALGVGARLLGEHLEGWRFHLANLAAHAEDDERGHAPERWNEGVSAVHLDRIRP
ncbi:hypothetical protein GCM10025783_05850 [Amnibacterium soli]|uniref:Activator of Hsp90 ATPase homologue 1/2-like C-terminal domain-containing protein n=1 Tax=Amnibacterium soli TaxID=1282736 RepID=A0ABP8YVN9_9MICO